MDAFIDFIMKIIQCLINGLSTGSIYALVALGYTMVYGIIKLINFAHGDFIMIGCYVAFIFVPIFYQINPNLVWLAFPIVIALCSLLGVATEKIAYKPLRKSKRITALITAIGVSIFIQNVFLAIYGSNAQYTKNGTYFPLHNIKAGQLLISTNAIITISLLIICTVLLTLFVKYTRAGKSMKAVSENPKAAELMGINVNKTISITFAIGSGLAGVAACIYFMTYPQITPTLGGLLGIKAFVAAVLGGIGLIPGAVLGGLLIGILEALFIGFGQSKWADAIVFAILIIILLVKPAGILGKNRKEKV